MTDSDIANSTPMAYSTGENVAESDVCCKEELDKLKSDKTVKELRAMGSYLQDCAYKMENELSKTVTYDEFEKVLEKKEVE